MAELSDNVRWLVTNLIDQDQRICVELQRRGEEYTAAGRPRCVLASWRPLCERCFSAV